MLILKDFSVKNFLNMCVSFQRSSQSTNPNDRHASCPAYDYSNMGYEQMSRTVENSKMNDMALANSMQYVISVKQSNRQYCTL